MTNKYNSLFDLLRAALGDHVLPADDFLGLFAEDIIVNFPFAPAGTPKRLDGMAALAAHATRLGVLLEFGELALGPIHVAGNTVIFEASCAGRGVETGVPYDQNYICVVELRDKQIVRYQDYWNPLVLISALGGQQALAAAYAR